MKKIENVIEDCTECRESKEFVENGGNTDYILLCKQTHAILARHSGKIKKYLNVEIPASCPLEDYDPKN